MPFSNLFKENSNHSDIASKVLDQVEYILSLWREILFRYWFNHLFKHFSIQHDRFRIVIHNKFDRISFYVFSATISLYTFLLIMYVKAFGKEGFIFLNLAVVIIRQILGCLKTRFLYEYFIVGNRKNEMRWLGRRIEHHKPQQRGQAWIPALEALQVWFSLFSLFYLLSIIAQCPYPITLYKLSLDSANGKFLGKAVRWRLWWLGLVIADGWVVYRWFCPFWVWQVISLCCKDRGGFLLSGEVEFPDGDGFLIRGFYIGTPLIRILGRGQRNHVRMIFLSLMQCMQSWTGIWRG